MTQQVGRIVDVVGMAIVIGLVLRYGPSFAQIVGAVGNASVELVKALTLVEA